MSPLLKWFDSKLHLLKWTENWKNPINIKIISFPLPFRLNFPLSLITKIHKSCQIHKFAMHAKQVFPQFWLK